MGNKDFQYGISRFWGKYGRETVFSTLDGAGNYKKNNEKSELVIKNFKKIFFEKLFFAFHACQVFGTFENFKNLKMLYNVTCKCQSIFIFHSF